MQFGLLEFYVAHISIVINRIQMFTTGIVKLTRNCLTLLFWCTAELGFPEEFHAIEVFLLYFIINYKAIYSKMFNLELKWLPSPLTTCEFTLNGNVVKKQKL